MKPQTIFFFGCLLIAGVATIFNGFNLFTSQTVAEALMLCSVTVWAVCKIVSGLIVEKYKNKPELKPSVREKLAVKLTSSLVVPVCLSLSTAGLILFGIKVFAPQLAPIIAKGVVALYNFNEEHTKYLKGLLIAAAGLLAIVHILPTEKYERVARIITKIFIPVNIAGTLLFFVHVADKTTSSYIEYAIHFKKIKFKDDQNVSLANQTPPAEKAKIKKLVSLYVDHIFASLPQPPKDARDTFRSYEQFRTVFNDARVSIKEDQAQLPKIADIYQANGTYYGQDNVTRIVDDAREVKTPGSAKYDYRPNSLNDETIAAVEDESKFKKLMDLLNDKTTSLGNKELSGSAKIIKEAIKENIGEWVFGIVDDKVACFGLDYVKGPALDIFYDKLLAGFNYLVGKKSPSEEDLKRVVSFVKDDESCSAGLVQNKVWDDISMTLHFKNDVHITASKFEDLWKKISVAPTVEDLLLLKEYQDYLSPTENELISKLVPLEKVAAGNVEAAAQVDRNFWEHYFGNNTGHAATDFLTSSEHLVERYRIALAAVPDLQNAITANTSSGWGQLRKKYAGSSYGKPVIERYTACAKSEKMEREENAKREREYEIERQRQAARDAAEEARKSYSASQGAEEMQASSTEQVTDERLREIDRWLKNGIGERQEIHLDLSDPWIPLAHKTYLKRTAYKEYHALMAPPTRQELIAYCKSPYYTNRVKSTAGGVRSPYPTPDVERFGSGAATGVWEHVKPPESMWKGVLEHVKPPEPMWKIVVKGIFKHPW